MMKNRTLMHGLGMLILVVTVLLASGCCARLQSPIVFENCGGGWGGYCGNNCWDPCNPCGPNGPPVPCNPSY